MTRKIKFALEMADGTMVRNNLEELRQHFDIERIICYFLNGKLIEWLEDRYYDDEAGKIAELDKNSPILNRQICEILGVSYSESDSVDVESLEKINKKKSILMQKTSDQSIINNASITAFSQEDLADLLDNDEPIIYLLGEKFNIPIRLTNKKYIGILCTPTIIISAKSDNELHEKNIVFENVILPWTKKETENHHKPSKPITALTNSQSPKSSSKQNDTSAVDDDFVEAYREIFYSTFGDSNDNKLWEIRTRSNCFTSGELSSSKKKLALRLICQGAYQEKDLIHIRVADDLSAGFALTRDSICFGGNFGNIIVPYQEIDASTAPISVSQKFTGAFSFDEEYTYILNTISGELFLASAIEHKGLNILHDNLSNLNSYLKTAAHLAVSLNQR